MSHMTQDLGLTRLKIPDLSFPANSAVCTAYWVRRFRFRASEV